jgi:hypothetical protein
MANPARTRRGLRQYRKTGTTWTLAEAGQQPTSIAGGVQSERVVLV